MTARDVVRDKLAVVTGARDLQPLEARLAPLEVAVAENAALASPLARVVDDLERAVAEVIERSGADAVGT